MVLVRSMYGIKIILKDIGMNEKLKGFLYSCYAVEIICRSYYFIKIEKVYSEISQRLNISASCVERSIRYAIEKTWEQGNIENINSIFGYTIDKERGKPTNREFLFMIAEKIFMNKSE